MVHLLGQVLPNRRFVADGLALLFGIGKYTGQRICARFQIHDRTRMRDLTPGQLSQLTSYLSQPATLPRLPKLPLAGPHFKAPFEPPPVPTDPVPVSWLKELKIETDLRRDLRENLAHHRMIGSYVGKRHAMNLPVRGQRTKTNAKTARKFNRIERRV